MLYTNEGHIYREILSYKSGSSNANAKNFHSKNLGKPNERQGALDHESLPLLSGFIVQVSAKLG